MTRIGFADHLFLRMHHGIGHPVYNQFVWRFDRRIDPAALQALHSRFAEGLLSRQVVRPTLPTARHRWVPSGRAHDLEIDIVPLNPADLKRWARDAITPDIDPERGLGWKLRAAPLSGGGSVVSLVCSHMVADGAALIAAVRAANGAATGSPLEPRPSVVFSVRDDLADTASELAPVLKWLGRKVSGAISRPGDASGSAGDPSSARTRPAPTRSIPPVNEAEWSPPYVLAECDSAAWADAATLGGGTPSSLFVAVLTEIARVGGRATGGDDVRWSLPVSTRLVDDGVDRDNRSNTTKIVKVAVPAAPEPVLGDHIDLTATRTALKAAFTEFSARNGAHPPDALPLQLIQLLPDALVAKIPQPKDDSEGLCSHLGVLPDDFLVLGGVRARSVVAHASFADVDADSARSLGGGLTAWAADTGENVTLCIHGMDPDRFTGDQELEKMVAAAFGRWGLEPRFR